jgi:hypothetical protein
VSIRPQKSVNTIAALAAFQDEFITAVSVEYATVAEDGLGGVFAWDETSTATVDNYNVVAHYSGTGRWLRVDQDNFTEVRNNLSDVNNAEISLNNLGTPNYLGSKNSGSYWFFDGTTSKITAPSSAFLSFTSAGGDVPFSIGSWIYITDTDTFPVIGKYGYLVSEREWLLSVFNNELIFYLADGTGGFSTATSTGTALAGLKNQWVHVAATCSAASSNTLRYNDLTLYVNGLAVASTNENTGTYTGMQYTAGEIAIGYFATGNPTPQYWAHGLMRTVSVYNILLSAAEILQAKNDSLDDIAGYAGSTAVNYGSWLVEGRSYVISSYSVGDDFTSSGASANASGEQFTYNGTLPTWGNGSTVVGLGLILGLQASDTVGRSVSSKSFYGFDGTLAGAQTVAGFSTGGAYFSYTTDPDRAVIQVIGGISANYFQVTEDCNVSANAIIIPLTTSFQTISGGVITVAGGYYRMIPEGGAPGTDDLDTINGGTDGMRLILKTADNTGDVTLKHNTGNILLQGDQDLLLGDVTWHVELLYDGLASKWVELTRRDDSVTIGISE